MRRGGSIRSAVAAAIAALGMLPGCVLAAGPLSFRAEASYTSDDNVTRSKGEGEALSDGILGAGARAIYPVPISTRTRAILQGFAGAEKFGTYTGLSRNFIGAQGDLQFRPSGEFGAPTYSAFLRTSKDEYESNLRDGYRHSFGVSVLKPATDRVQFFGALAVNVSDGRSTVFDTRNVSLRGNADWSVTRWDVVYVGAEYRGGDVVSTLSRNDPIRTLGFVNTAAPNIVQDDAFTDTVRDAYRFKAVTWVATLGYNRAFGGRHSLDVSWRRAQSAGQNPVDPATASDLRYTVNQYSLAYLARF
jgi:hypothetical protein